MANRRRSRLGEEDCEIDRRHYERNSNNTPGAPAARKILPRSCKTAKPFYGMDGWVEEEETFRALRTKKKRAGLPSSSSTTDAARSQGRHPRTKLASTMIEKQEPKEEMNIISNNILAWLIEMDVVRENTMLRCVHGTNKEVIGYGVISRKGIICICCNKLFSVSNFPRHRGDYLTDKPYENIFVGSLNVSLLTCQIEAWNRHSLPARSGYHHVVRRPRVQDNSDDSCVICADGGDLICCEKCPSTYHPKCLGFKDVPQDEWLCPYCHCKYCDRNNLADVLLTCFQCLKKYHSRCSDRFDIIPQRPQPLSIPFCGSRCLKVYQKLEERLGRTVQTGRGYSWTLVRKMDLDLAGQNAEDLYLKANCNSKVVLAAKLMEESFKLIVDRQTRTNMIQSVIYNCGSNFTRTNFSRFYTAILESEEGQIVSVASLRLPSPEITEIPFIVTAEGQRNNGLCKILLTAIESALANMGVGRVVIPSSEEMEEKWRKNFSFTTLDEEMNRKLTSLNTLMFPKTIRLQKVMKDGKRVMLHHDLNLAPPEEEQTVNFELVLLV